MFDHPSEGPQVWSEVALSKDLHSLKGVVERYWMSIKIDMQLSTLCPKEPRGVCPSFPNKDLSGLVCSCEGHGRVYSGFCFGVFEKNSRQKKPQGKA